MPNVINRLERLEKFAARKQAFLAPDKEREPMSEETAARVFDILLEAIGPEELRIVLLANGATLPELEDLDL